MALIEVAGVDYIYADGQRALKNVSLKIDRGERVAVLGPNGAGKSTLFQLFNGLLSPSAGDVLVKNLWVRKENLAEIRRSVGMVFQDPDDQLFNSTVRQEIAYGLLNMRVSGKALEEAVSWALEVVGLNGYGGKSPHNLSGGEKKRVALASVLAMRPEVLVLDEPTAALDPRGVARLIRLLNSINRELGITLIFATHDVDIVPLLADRIYLLSQGEILLGGTTAEVFRRKELIRQVDLRLPRVAHLVELLEREGVCAPSELPLTIGRAKGFLTGQLRGSGGHL
ncbi:energy-coupling factor ABC transporter ATP-binding protein [Acididesulfobacillus acetoxydans]|nr:ATP-binding cassette domain-containing protein [Acididesulfobacillus acetoxydans]